MIVNAMNNAQYEPAMLEKTCQHKCWLLLVNGLLINNNTYNTTDMTNSHMLAVGDLVTAA